LEIYLFLKSIKRFIIFPGAQGRLALAALDEKGRTVLALNPAGATSSPIPRLPRPGITVLGRQHSCIAGTSTCKLAHEPSRVCSLRSTVGNQREMHSGAPHGWIASVSPSTLLERRNGYADACSSAAIAFATPAPYAGSAIVQCSICNCWTGFDTPFSARAVLSNRVCCCSAVIWRNNAPGCE